MKILKTKMKIAIKLRFLATIMCRVDIYFIFYIF